MRQEMRNHPLIRSAEMYRAEAARYQRHAWYGVIVAAIGFIIMLCAVALKAFAADPSVIEGIGPRSPLIMAHAVPRLRVENRSKLTIQGIRVAPSLHAWGSDLLGSSTLEPGRARAFIPQRVCMFDITIRFLDAPVGIEDLEVMDADLCENPILRLFGVQGKAVIHELAIL